MRLGTCADGSALTYDPGLYEFRLDRMVTPYENIRELDDAGHIHWHALEQRDWFIRIDAADLARCRSKALARRGQSAYEGMTPEERVQADAARDDSVLAGKIVEADPSLVAAVALQLEEQGLLGGGSGHRNPLAAVDLPRGMEALSQFERSQGGQRKMTAAEKRLMRKIIKNDDKEKARREKSAQRIADDAARKKERAEAQNAAPAQGPAGRGSRDADIEVQQRRRRRKHQQEQDELVDYQQRAAARGHAVDDDPLADLEDPMEGFYEELLDDLDNDLPLTGRFAAAGLDAGGDPVRPVENEGEQVSAEERALVEMRRRNRAAAQAMSAAGQSGVPGATAVPGAPTAPKASQRVAGAAPQKEGVLNKVLRIIADAQKDYSGPSVGGRI